MAIRLVGADAIDRRLRVIADESPKEFARALKEELKIEQKEAYRQTPLDTGALRSTIKVTGPDTRGRLIYGGLQAGGPEAPYALYVHEDLFAFHPIGNAKFIERPLNQSAPHMANRIAKRINLNRMR